ncbi:MAG: gliding motility-associated C-terminal domain-containing protein, partial [Bacteroidota bacterium]
DNQAINLGESVTLNAITNLDNPLVTWIPVGPIDCPDCLTGNVTPAETTTYAIILVDENGCTAADEVTITVTKFKNLFFANIFSPDDDGINDFFYIQADPAQVAIVRTFQVYDRWGELVFSGTNIPPNDPSLGWNGRFRGDRAPLGVYAFFAEIEFIDGIVEVVKGDVTLIR